MKRRGKALAARRAVCIPVVVAISMTLCGGCQRARLLHDMVLVPAGKFTMGGDPRFAREGKAVFVDAFYIDKHEVTNRAYKQFIDATGRKPPEQWSGGTYPKGMEKYPVYGVTWQDADAYALWVGKRLPTEEEWEKAGRGADGRVYPWGNEFDPNKCNAWESKSRSSGYGPGSLDPVDSHPEGKSPFGCYNMTGNVWEWTSSPDGMGGRILRGGSCGKYGLDIPLTRRDAAGHPGDDVIRIFTGFRCAESCEPKKHNEPASPAQKGHRYKRLGSSHRIPTKTQPGSYLNTFIANYPIG